MNYIDIIVMPGMDDPYIRGIYGDFGADEIALMQEDLREEGLSDDLDRFVAPHLGSFGCRVRCEPIWCEGETQAGSNPADILVIPGYFELRPIEIVEVLNFEEQ